MWWQILPGAAIITATVAFPHYFAWAANWLVLGNPYRRSTGRQDEILQYLRDWRLKHPYKLVGLENIPDEDECEEQQQNEKIDKDDECEDGTEEMVTVTEAHEAHEHHEGCTCDKEP